MARHFKRNHKAYYFETAFVFVLNVYSCSQARRKSAEGTVIAKQLHFSL